MIAGYKIPGTEYVLPSLSADQAIGFDDNGYFRRIESQETHHAVRMILIREMIHAALSRNHPEVTVEQVGELMETSGGGLYLITCGVPPAKAAEMQANPPPAV
jgi:hypothetical protein